MRHTSSILQYDYIISKCRFAILSACIIHILQVQVCGWKIKLMDGFTDGEKIKGKSEEQKRFYSGGIDCCYCNYFGVGGGYGAECDEICCEG